MPQKDLSSIYNIIILSFIIENYPTMINKSQIVKKILIVVGLISIIILISLLIQQKITEPIKEQRKSEFICPKPPTLCVCKNFLSLNRPILNKDDLDDAVELFLKENDMRKENVSIDIGESRQQKGWYLVTVTNTAPPYYYYAFHIDNSTGDFWYLFGCV